MNSRHIRKGERGMSLVEIVVAAALCSMTVLGIVGAFVFAVREARENMARVQAAYLAEEGLEAARVMRDNGWTANIASQPAGMPRYLAFDGVTWSATSTATTTGAFTRMVQFDTVYRDNSNNIAAAGTADSNTKKVTVTVSWESGSATTSRSLVTYLANIYGN